MKQKGQIRRFYPDRLMVALSLVALLLTVAIPSYQSLRQEQMVIGRHPGGGYGRDVAGSPRPSSVIAPCNSSSTAAPAIGVTAFYRWQLQQLQRSLVPALRGGGAMPVNIPVSAWLPGYSESSANIRPWSISPEGPPDGGEYYPSGAYPCRSRPTMSACVPAVSAMSVGCPHVESTKDSTVELMVAMVAGLLLVAAVTSLSPPSSGSIKPPCR